MIVTVTLNPVLDRTMSVSKITFNSVLRANQSRLDWGGKGLNVSRTLKALGQTTIASGFFGGNTGRILRDGLEALGIVTDFQNIGGETRTNTVIIEEKRARHIKVNEAGPLVSEEEQEAFLRYVEEHAVAGDIWAFCGSLPPGVAADYYARLIQIAQAKGAKAVLDTSGEALRLGCAAAPYMVKPNRDEAASVTGMPLRNKTEILQAAQAILKLGVQIVAISLGSKGLLLVSKEQIVRVRPPRIEERNPTGAGDALLGGVLISLAQGYSLERAARLGVACGTASASNEGVGVVTREDVERFYATLDKKHPLPILPDYLMTSEPGSFARSTIVERKPLIIRQVMEDYPYPDEIKANLQAFAEEIASKTIQPLREDAADVSFWNREWLVYQGKTWLEIPWYFAETYFYRRLLECVRYLQPGAWLGVDPFGKQKEKQISADIQHLGNIWAQFESLEVGDEFQALLHSCLWGNRTDLSNFTVKVKAAQGAAAKSEEENILINHTQQVYDLLRTGVSRVDFINDNAGTDSLFDLAMTDFLLRQKWVGEIIFHLKDRPFFVSDATPQDILLSVERLRSDAEPSVRQLGERLDRYISNGHLRLQTHPFWSSCLMFRQMPEEVSTQLAEADLVIVKGDVNYRRMLDDRHWAHHTPLEEAAGYFPAPFVFLRTLKGEIMLGLAEGEAEGIEKIDSTWLINGKRGVIHFFMNEE